MKLGKTAVRIGLVGAGFAAAFHLDAYEKVYGVDVEVVAITSRNLERARGLAERHGGPRVYSSVAELLADRDINVVDLCVPVHVHGEMTIAAADARKHVICEKPLVGFSGSGKTPKVQMYREVRGELARIRAALETNGVRLHYAENWVYAPATRRCDELLAASGGTILHIQGHEAHSGSASEFSKRWETSGGGSLLRLGIHPLSAAIHLKHQEGLRRGGKPIKVQRVYGQVADLTSSRAFRAEEWQWLATGWDDVENWSLSILTFDDDTTAMIYASDIALGGIESGLDVYLSNSRVRCRLNPSDGCMAFAPDASVFGDVFLNEKLETGAGWSFPAVDHGWTSGYQQEFQDFAEAIAADRPPLSGMELAEECISVAYAAYASAEQGRQLALAELDG